MVGGADSKAAAEIAARHLRGGAPREVKKGALEARTRASSCARLEPRRAGMQQASVHVLALLLSSKRT